MSIVAKPAWQRQAKPRRKQFDFAHHDRQNLKVAEAMLRNPEGQPAGLIRWARLFVDRLDREGGLR
jgi:hypothetical protein